MNAAAQRTEELPLPGRALVVGLGKTGYSVVRYLLSQGVRVAITDSRESPPQLPALIASGYAGIVRTGRFDAALLAEADLVVLSPGVAPTGEFFDAARARGLPIVGDIELFARAARAPVVGITGTNGKSTVTTLLARMASASGREVRVGGNLGAPALDLLDPAAQLYVLELSSFQLESTSSLALAAATVLNLSADHLDRYPDLDGYAAAKARIFERCELAVINLDDARVPPMRRAGQRSLSFSLEVASADYRLTRRGADDWLVARGEAVLPLAELKLMGRHNAANALAALALADAIGLPRNCCLSALRAFAGLPHRTEWVANVGGVRYLDDSKGTNVAATLAAVGGLPGKLVLIAGGEGKGQDFAPLRAGFAGKVRLALLIGRDARRLGEALGDVCEHEYCASLEAAVARAAALARPGETVLLSPACASLDMFRDYAHRGEAFAQAVRGMRP